MIIKFEDRTPEMQERIGVRARSEMERFLGCAGCELSCDAVDDADKQVPIYEHPVDGHLSIYLVDWHAALEQAEKNCPVVAAARALQRAELEDSDQ